MEESSDRTVHGVQGSTPLSGCRGSKGMEGEDDEAH